MCTNMVVIYCMHVFVHGGGVVWPDRSSQISSLSGRPDRPSGLWQPCTVSREIYICCILGQSDRGSRCIRGSLCIRGVSYSSDNCVMYTPLFNRNAIAVPDKPGSLIAYKTVVHFSPMHGVFSISRTCTSNRRSLKCCTSYWFNYKSITVAEPRHGTV